MQTERPCVSATLRAKSLESESPAAAAALDAHLSVFPTCFELLSRHPDSSSRKIPFLCPSLDAALGGGLQQGAPLTEIAGPPGAGKSCLLLQLCASYLAGVSFSQQTPGGPPSLGGCLPPLWMYTAGRGPQGCALFIDCDGSFRVERFLEIARGTLACCSSSSGSSRCVETAEDLLQRLVVVRVFSSKELQQLLDFLLSPSASGAPHALDVYFPCLSAAAAVGPPSPLQRGGPPERGGGPLSHRGGAPLIGLVAVDSLTSLLHPALHRGGWAAGKTGLQIGFLLLRFADTQQAAVAVATKTTAPRPGAGIACCVSSAIGGPSLSILPLPHVQAVYMLPLDSLKCFSSFSSFLHFLSFFHLFAAEGAQSFLGRAWGHLPGLRLRLSRASQQQPLFPFRQLEMLQCLYTAGPDAATGSSKGFEPLLLRVAAEGAHEEGGGAPPLQEEGGPARRGW
ncbi:hypothetical protein Efla_002791 [Eimeria flavescens]